MLFTLSFDLNWIWRCNQKTQLWVRTFFFCKYSRNPYLDQNKTWITVSLIHNVPYKYVSFGFCRCVEVLVFWGHIYIVLFFHHWIFSDYILSLRLLCFYLINISYLDYSDIADWHYRLKLLSNMWKIASFYDYSVQHFSSFHKITASFTQ